MPMLLHFLVNSFSVVADKFHMGEMDTAPEQIPWILYLGSGLLLAAVAWALYRSRTQLTILTEQGIAPWRPDFPGVEFPPPENVTVANRPWPGWLASGLVLVGILGFAGSIYWAAMQ
jgi:hypothetical protein